LRGRRGRRLWNRVGDGVDEEPGGVGAGLPLEPLAAEVVAATPVRVADDDADGVAAGRKAEGRGVDEQLERGVPVGTARGYEVGVEDEDLVEGQAMGCVGVAAGEEEGAGEEEEWGKRIGNRGLRAVVAEEFDAGGGGGQARVAEMAHAGQVGARCVAEGA